MRKMVVAVIFLTAIGMLWGQRAEAHHEGALWLDWPISTGILTSSALKNLHFWNGKIRGWKCTKVGELALRFRIPRNRGGASSFVPLFNLTKKKLTRYYLPLKWFGTYGHDVRELLGRKFEEDVVKSLAESGRTLNSFCGEVPKKDCLERLFKDQIEDASLPDSWDPEEIKKRCGSYNVGFTFQLKGTLAADIYLMEAFDMGLSFTGLSFASGEIVVIGNENDPRYNFHK